MSPAESEHGGELLQEAGEWLHVPGDAFELRAVSLEQARSKFRVTFPNDLERFDPWSVRSV
jgi:hypothetical protein